MQGLARQDGTRARNEYGAVRLGWRDILCGCDPSHERIRKCWMLCMEARGYAFRYSWWGSGPGGMHALAFSLFAVRLALLQLGAMSYVIRSV